jgi:hypothetical protein
VREHRNKVAETARHDGRDEEPEDSGSISSDPHPESADQTTGEERAARNREEDPPA